MPVLDPFGRAATPRAAPIDTAQVLDQFRAALIARDIIPPEPIVADGHLHRCNAVGRHGKGDAAYVLHLDGLPAGEFENHRDGRDWETWRFELGRLPTAAERDRFAQVAQVARRMRDDDLRHRQQEVRAKAERIWAAAMLALDTHPYLARKAVCAYGLRVFKGALVVPVCDLAGALHSLQFISRGGVKRFLRGGRVKGLCGWIGDLPQPSGDADLTLLVAEGVATAASLHEVSGYPVVIAFHAGNLGVVATALRAGYPQGSYRGVRRR